MIEMKHLHLLYTLAFGLAVLLFFGLAYPHHLHYQEQYQLFLFDPTYVCDIVRLPGGVADLLGRFCTQFFLFAWVGAAIIAVLLSAVQLLTLRLGVSPLQPSPLGGGFRRANSSPNGGRLVGSLYGLSFVPSLLLWLFLLDENALLGGVWAVLLTLLAIGCLRRLPRVWIRPVLIIVAIPVVYWMVGPAWTGSHYHRYPTVVPVLLYAAWLSAVVLPFLVRALPRKVTAAKHYAVSLTSFALVAVVMGSLVSKNSNFKAEKVMAYDFMARHQQWNRILQTANAEKPNNQIGVTVQNLALAMHGMLAGHLFDYHQNGIAGLLPDVKEDATSPLPTAEAFYQLGMTYVAQRTVFEAQEAILDFQKSGRCYKRLAQTNLINGQYEVARKYLSALQKTLFYRDWANETLPLLGDEEAIARHPEYGRLRQSAYHQNFFFSDHVTPEMLESLLRSNPDNRIALEYLKAYYMLTGDRDSYTQLLLQLQKP